MAIQKVDFQRNINATLEEGDWVILKLDREFSLAAKVASLLVLSAEHQYKKATRSG